MRRVIAFAAVLGLFVAGCGKSEPRIDATDSASLDESVAAMTAGMSDADRDRLAADALVVAKPPQIRSAFRETFIKGSKAAGRPLAFKPLDGMTAAEIHAKAEEIRSGGGKAPAKK